MNTWRTRIRRALRAFGSALPPGSLESVFGAGETLEVVLSAVLGSLAAGHPLVGFVLGARPES